MPRAAARMKPSTCFIWKYKRK